MWSYNENNVGEFTEVEHGCVFTYRKTEDWHHNPYGMPYMIDVLDGIRFGIVKKTVVYVCVDENADGKPVMEKWQIKKHRIYE
jgi:hypothetical protein